MYGRNIFSGSNYNSPSFNSSGPRLGSQRTDYRCEQPSKQLMNLLPQYDKVPPMSIVTREQTLHLTPTELRLEDYYVMRKGQVPNSMEGRLRDAIQKGCFNREILNYQFERVMKVSEERQVDIDSLRGRYGGGGYSGGYSGDYRSDNRGSGNVFINRDNSNATNIFRNGSSGGGYSSGGYNNGGYSSGGGGGGYGNNNIFGRDNNNSSGNNNSSIFGSRGGGNSSGNIFSGGNSSGNNNIFSNNNNNNSSNNNIFGNRNNNSSNNIFSNNNNNNNIFSNNNNSGNIFSNNNNRGNSNNLFTGNSAPPPALSAQMVYSLKMMFDQNRHFMQKISEQLNPTKDESPPHYQYVIADTPTPFDNLDKGDSGIPAPEEFLKDRRRKEEEEKIIVVEVSEKGGSLSGSRSVGGWEGVAGMSRVYKNGSQSIVGNGTVSNIRANGYSQMSMGRPGNSLLLPNPSFSSQFHPQPRSTRLNNLTHSRLTNHSHQPQNTLSMQYHYTCTCQVELQIKWLDDPHDMMPMDNPIKVRVKMPNFKPGVREWQERLVEELKKEEECVRRDARVEVKDVKEDGNDASLFVLKVVLEQRIVNTPEEYSVKYSKIVNRQLHNLTINNDKASISWQAPIKATALDFRINNQVQVFELTEYSITCEMEALNQPCKVTFFKLPKEVGELYKVDQERARTTFGQYVGKMSEGKFSVVDMWDNGWEMKVTSFPEVEVEEGD